MTGDVGKSDQQVQLIMISKYILPSKYILRRKYRD